MVSGLITDRLEAQRLINIDLTRINALTPADRHRNCRSGIRRSWPKADPEAAQTETGPKILLVSRVILRARNCAFLRVNYEKVNLLQSHVEILMGLYSILTSVSYQGLYCVDKSPLVE